MCSWLLFSLEPLSSKLLLPKLGGSPAVWISCLVFFQGALLAGYGYAHLSIRLLGLRRQAMLHIALVAISFLFIPVSLGATLDPEGDGAPVLWLIGALSASIGVPFMVLSSFAPIAQRWFAAGSGQDTRSPYFLYAASNLGSLLALIAYPFVVERFIGLALQTRVWSATYTVVLLAVAVMAARVIRRSSAAQPEADMAPGESRITLSDRARWLLYAAVPSSALMGATSFISLDLGSFPLLWVLPLAVYLASFIIVFARRPPLRHSLMVKAEPQLIVLVSLTIFWGITLPGLPFVVMHLALLFLIAMVCHGELARSRPDPRYLTGFYLWIAAGGLCGGVFNAVIAPLVFDDVLEYPIIIVAAALLRPRGKQRAPAMDAVLPIVFGAALLAATWRPGIPPQVLPTLSMFVFGVILFSFRDYPRRFAFALAIMFAIGLTRLTAEPSGRRLIDSERSFFGVYRVLENPSRSVRMLEHGSTIHGAQSLLPQSKLAPLTYYTTDGPAGDVFSRTEPGRMQDRRVALVGLGVGSLACYGRAEEAWTFFEIAPSVVKLATDTTHFTLLRDCPPDPRFVLGDARLTLAREPAASADILVVDAFNSGAIPVHLLTKEALGEYLRVVGRRGVIAVHITNSHMNLEPLVAALAADAGLEARVRMDFPPAARENPITHSPSVWVVLGRDNATFGELTALGTWRPLRPSAGLRAWTDDHSSILSVIRWR